MPAAQVATGEEDDNDDELANFAGLPAMLSLVKLNFAAVESGAVAQRTTGGGGGAGARPLTAELGMSFVRLPTGRGETKRTLAWLAVGYDRRQQKYPVDNLWAYGAQPAQLERVRRTGLQRAGAGVS